MKPARAHRWLVLVPMLGFLAGSPFANHVRPWVFGLPFLLFWVVGCVLATSATLAIVHALDRRAERAAGAGPAVPGSGGAPGPERPGR